MNSINSVKNVSMNKAGIPDEIPQIAVENSEITEIPQIPPTQDESVHTGRHYKNGMFSVKTNGLGNMDISVNGLKGVGLSNIPENIALNIIKSLSDKSFDKEDRSIASIDSVSLLNPAESKEAKSKKNQLLKKFTNSDVDYYYGGNGSKIKKRKGRIIKKDLIPVSNGEINEITEDVDIFSKPDNVKKIEDIVAQHLDSIYKSQPLERAQTPLILPEHKPFELKNRGDLMAKYAQLYYNH